MYPLCCFDSCQFTINLTLVTFAHWIIRVPKLCHLLMCTEPCCYESRARVSIWTKTLHTANPDRDVHSNQTCPMRLARYRPTALQVPWKSSTVSYVIFRYVHEVQEKNWAYVEHHEHCNLYFWMYANHTSQSNQCTPNRIFTIYIAIVFGAIRMWTRGACG